MPQSPDHQIYGVQFGAIEASQMYAALTAKVQQAHFSPKQKIGRLALNLLLAMLPTTLEIRLVSYLKKNAAGKVHLAPSTFFITRLIAAGRLRVTPRYPQQRQFYLSLTFDIDYQQDYELLPYFLEDLAQSGLPATINLLTHAGYPISAAFLREAQQSGFEIGLHGDTHNTALAFLPKPVIRRKLQRALDRLGFLPCGYRSPGLSHSRNLIEVLDELGFSYDSSLTTGIARYVSLEFPYLFQYPGLRLVEAPLFMQDYNFFVNDLFAEQDAIAIFAAQIAEMAQIGGAAIINLHPALSFPKKAFWQALLGLCQTYRETAYLGTIAKLLSDKGIGGQKPAAL